MWYHVNPSRVAAYTVFSAISIVITLVFAGYLTKREVEIVESHVTPASPAQCKEFASILSTRNAKVFCDKGIIETQEMQSGNVLVVCRCEDPLRLQASEERKDP